MPIFNNFRVIITVNNNKMIFRPYVIAITTITQSSLSFLFIWNFLRYSIGKLWQDILSFVMFLLSLLDPKFGIVLLNT